MMLTTLALSACMTHADKPKLAATEAAAPQDVPTQAELLAAALNAKADAAAQKTGKYRDPMVRTASGRQIPLLGAPGDTLAMNGSPPPSDGAVDVPSMAGLATQPTAVNANRTSIFSSAMPAVAPQYLNQADGPEAASGVGDTAASQAITPAVRSVYSAPMPVMPAAPIMIPVQAPPQQGIDLFAHDQSAQAAPAPGQPVHAYASASPMKPVSDATPSKIMPAPGSHGHTIDSQEALMMARATASKQQQGGGTPGDNKVRVMGTPMPKGMIPQVSMTPGMAASLKQPIAFKPGAGDGTKAARQDKVRMANLPLRF